MAIQQISSLASAIAAPAAVATPSRPAPAGSSERPAAPPPTQLLPNLQATEPKVREAVKEIAAAVAPVARNLQFSVDKETGKTIVRVVDSATNEVIRQIPGEEVLAIAQAIDRMQGLLFKQKA